VLPSRDDTASDRAGREAIMSLGPARESFAPIGSNQPDCDNYFCRDCRRIVHVRKGSPGFRACPTPGVYAADRIRAVREGGAAVDPPVAENRRRISSLGGFMKPFAAALIASAFILATPAPGKTTCSVKPAKGTAKDQLPGLAKVSEADARKAAITAVKTNQDVTVKSSELEIEKGCLIWSFDLSVGTMPGIQEVQIDAGNGKVLSSEHESPKHEAAEQKKDSAPKH
jgi:hypothetical protein